VHVHGKYQGRESKAELIIKNGKVVEIIIKPVKGRAPLTTKELKYFEEFVEGYSDKIVQKWIDYFVLHKKISCEHIERAIE
jgi:hypothetical protein